MSTARNLDRYDDASKHAFTSIEDFLSVPTPDGISSIDYNGSPLDLLVRKKANAHTTIIVFHPAVPSAGATLPMFMGLGIADAPEANTIFVADPSLEWDSELLIAWFAGNSSQPIQNDLPKVLKHILRSLGSKHTVFYGASAGGFAALYYSAHFDKSLVISVNPQTDILEYNERFVLEYVSSCWVASNSDSALSNLRSVTSSEVLSVYSKKRTNTILYVQNETDWHVKRHMTPFVDSSPRMNGFYRLMGNWGKGHVAPPSALQARLLAAAVASRGVWSNAFKKFADIEKIVIYRPRKTFWLFPSRN